MRVDISGGREETPLWFVTTHIGLNGVQLEEVEQLLHEFVLQELITDAPVIITGDFNAAPDSAAIQYLHKSHSITDTWLQCGKGKV